MTPPCAQKQADASLMSLISMLPKEGESYTLPAASIMIADVSGFTALNEAFAALGAAGVEQVSKHLNLYFASLLDLIDKHGGDTYKFAGDALIVLFAPQGKNRVGSTADQAVDFEVKPAPTSSLPPSTKYSQPIHTPTPLRGRFRPRLWWRSGGRR